MNTAIEMASPAGIVDVPPSTYAAEELARVVRFAVRELCDFGNVVRLMAIKRNPGGMLSWYDQLKRGDETNRAELERFASAVLMHRNEVVVVNFPYADRDDVRVLYAPEWMR